MDIPFFQVKKINGKIITKGTPSCFMGHTVNGISGEKPEGVFSQWDWDGVELTVKNDRYGLYPLFYYCKNGEIGVSASIRKLLLEGAPRDLDYTALSVFLRIGYFVGDDTPFNGIKALLADTSFNWTSGKLTHKSNYVINTESLNLTYDEALDCYIDLFRKSIQKRLPSSGDFIFPLSGGKDSRLILFELNRAGAKPKYCLTTDLYPPRSNVDLQIAVLIAQELNIRHVIMEQPKKYFPVALRRNLMTEFCSDESIEGPAMMDHFRGKTDTVYHGMHGPRHNEYPGILSHYLSGGTQAFNKAYLGLQGRSCFQENNFSLFLNDHLASKLSKEAAEQRLTEEFKKYSELPNPFQQFYFWNRTRREISLGPYAIWRDIPKVYTPFLDYDLFEFSYRFGALYPNKIFVKDALTRAFPEYAHIPFASKRTLPVNPVPVRKKFVKDLLIYVLKNQSVSKRIFRNDKVITRLIKYMAFTDNWWICPHMIHYLLHLNLFVDSLEKGSIQSLAGVSAHD